MNKGAKAKDNEAPMEFPDYTLDLLKKRRDHLKKMHKHHMNALWWADNLRDTDARVTTVRDLEATIRFYEQEIWLEERRQKFIRFWTQMRDMVSRRIERIFK